MRADINIEFDIPMFYRNQMKRNHSKTSLLYFSFGRGMPVLSQDGKVSLAGQSGEAPVDHILNSINVVISAN